MDNISPTYKDKCSDRQLIAEYKLLSAIDSNHPSLPEYESLEIIQEYIKALRYAEKYKTNTIRIRRLLDQSPITINDGQAMINGINGHMLCGFIDNGPWHSRTLYVNPILICD